MQAANTAIPLDGRLSSKLSRFQKQWCESYVFEDRMVFILQ